MSRSFRKPYTAIVHASRECIKDFKKIERRRERRFLNENLDASDHKISKRIYQNEWNMPHDGIVYRPKEIKLYRK